MSIVIAREFGVTSDGRKVTAFELSNANGVTVTVLNFGGTIQSIVVPDRNGAQTDIALGYDDVESYEKGTCYYGAIVGRYANRIGGGRFILDGKEYLLKKNEEHNHVHGVFAKRIFDAVIENETLILRYLSPDMEEGYPGNLSVEVRYSLSEDNGLSIGYKATTDAPTVINLTNHCYFNLNGQDGSTILGHSVELNSSYYTEYADTFAQTGKIISVDNTPLDFRKERKIGERFNDEYYQLRLCTGYDHNMILDGKDGELKLAGRAKSDESGISVEVFTTEPAVHFYSGNYMHFDVAEKGKNGVRYPKNGGLCFEAQHYPDSVNHANFPSTELRPNDVYTQKTVYKFKTNIF